MSPGGPHPAAGGLYVLAGGRVWGPYGRERLGGFVAEGRVVASTPVGGAPEGPFLPAGRHPELSSLFGRAASAAGPEPGAGAERALVVWAALAPHRIGSFEQLLGAFGPWRKLGEGLWLARARMGPAALRNGLSRRLGEDDALLVVEAPLEQAAWFNLADDEAAVRSLWASGAASG